MQQVFEIPPKITPEDDNGYLEQLTKAIFRAGFSWLVLQNKWDNFQRAFDGFDLGKVADYGVEEATRLFNDSSIVRNRRKILATVDNARTMLALTEEFGSFHGYLRSLDHMGYYDRVQELTGLSGAWAAPAPSCSSTA
jgi:3-methyladenine DNA glycosylase Tag